MARISTYVKDTGLTDRDLLVGSNYVSGTSGQEIYETTNFTLKNVREFVSSNIVGSVDGISYITENVQLDGSTAKKVKVCSFPTGTTIIGDSFKQSELTTVNLPDSLVTIQDNAFNGNFIGSITIPNATTSIGNLAFNNNLLETVVIGDGVTTIGNEAFNNNANLSSVTLGNSVQSIGRLAFYNASISSITFPDTLLTIGEGAFRLNELTSVIIPNNVTSIGESGQVAAFYNGTFQENNISSLTLGSSLQVIGTSAFLQNQLTSVVIPDSVTEIGNVAFSTNLLTSVDLGSGVQYIREYAFIGSGGTPTNQITSLTIPDSTIEIEQGAFWYNNISSLTLGSGLTTIGALAFKGNNISTLSIPSSVTSIGSEAFGSQSVDITSMTFAQGTGLTIIGGAFDNGAFNLTSLTIPNNTISGGVNFAQSQIGALTIGSGCTVGVEDFKTSTMTTVNIGNNATIYEGAFSGAQMTSLTVGDDCFLTSPGPGGVPYSGPFNDITVGNIVFGDNLTTDTIQGGESFGYGPFSDSNGSGALSITGTFTSGDNIDFKNRAWFYETDVTSSGPSTVTFGPNFTNGKYAFYGAFSLSSFTFTGSPANTVPNGVTIPAYMFTSVHGFTSLTIGDNVTIDYSAFSDNPAVTSLTLGNNVTLTTNGNDSIYFSNRGNNFQFLGSNTSGLDLTIPGTTTLVDNAFDRAKINNLTIQNGITEIPNSCFTYSPITPPSSTPGYTFTSISIPSSVLTFRAYCFATRGFPSATTLTLGSAGNPITAEAYAFNCLTSGDTVNVPEDSTYVTGSGASFGQATVNTY